MWFHVVYGLISPRSGWVFYVGMTKSFSKRLYSHFSWFPKNSTAGIIREIKEDGLKPSYCVFGVFDDLVDAAIVEANLIASIPDLVNRAQPRVDDPVSSRAVMPLESIISRVLVGSFDKVAFQRKYMREVYRPKVKARREAEKNG